MIELNEQNEPQATQGQGLMSTRVKYYGNGRKGQTNNNSQISKVERSENRI
jgi:hypothetical protein